MPPVSIGDKDRDVQAFELSLRRSRDFETAVMSEVAGLPVESTRGLMSHLYLATALDHYRAIRHLLDDGRFHVSGFALVRPLMDAVFRCIWIAHLATDEQIEAATKPDGYRVFSSLYPPKISKLMKVKFKYDDDKMYEIVQSQWKDLNGFVHTGPDQLRSRMKFKKTKAFPYVSALPMLTNCSTFLMLGACYLATAAQKPEAALAIEAAFNKVLEGTDPNIVEYKLDTSFVN